MCTALRVDMLTENTGLPRWLSVSTRYAAAQADLVREIVGNPFRKSYPMWDKLRSGDVVPRASALSVLTPTVLSLAQAAYEERMTTQCYGCIVADNVHQVGVCSACDGAGRIDNGHLDPHRLGVLADALEEAGCEDQHCPHCVGGVWGEYESGEVIQCNCRHTALLSHLRGPGPHVRGCWALDLILGNV